MPAKRYLSDEMASGRFARFLRISLRVFGLTLLLGCILVPYWGPQVPVPNGVISRVRQSLSRQAGAGFTCESLQFYQLGHTLAFKATNVSVTGAESEQALVYAPSAVIQISLIPLFAGRLEIRRIDFMNPMVYVERGADSVLNWKVLLPKRSAKFRFSANWNFQNGKIIYRDRSEDAPVEALIDFTSLYIVPDLATGVLEIGAEFYPAVRERSRFEVNSLYEPETDEATFSLWDSLGNLTLAGTVKDIQSLPRFDGHLKLRGVQTSELLKKLHGFEGLPDLSGILNFSAEMQGEGIRPNPISSRRLNFSGAVEIRRGMVWGQNIIRRVFEELGVRAPMPTAGPSVDSPDFKIMKMFTLSDTPFDILKLQIKKVGELIEISDLLLQSKNYLLSAAGNYQVSDAFLDLRGELVVLEDAAARCVKQWPQLAAFRNPKNRLHIGFEVQGIVPNPTLSVGSQGGLRHNSRRVP